MFGRQAILAILVLVLLTGGASAGSSAVGTTGNSVPLGVVGFGSIVVYDARQEVFVSEPVANDVLDFDFDGRAIKGFPNLPGAGPMLIHGSTLYVLEPSVGTIEAIDLDTLTDTGPVTTGLQRPSSLVFAGGKLWATVDSGFSSCCLDRLASVAADGTVTTYENTTGYFSDSQLATNPADPNALYLAASSNTDTKLYRFDVSSGSPVLTVVNYSPAGVGAPIVSPDGQRLITTRTVAAPQHDFVELDPSSLMPDGVVYPTEFDYSSADAVSPADGGLLATGSDGSVNGGPSIEVFHFGSPQPAFTATTLSSFGHSNVMAHGLALSADGSRLFAVTHDDIFSTEFRLWVFDPRPVDTSTTVSVTPSPSGFGQSVTATATISPTDGTGTVAFLVNDTPITGCSALPLTLSPTTATATATCTSSTLPLGQDTVKAVYSGNAQYVGSSGTAVTPVGKGATAITASPAQLTKVKGSTYTTALSANLTSYGVAVAGRTVVFASGALQLCSAVTDVSGGANCTATVKSTAVYHGLQTNGYTASFNGDSQLLASSTQARVSG
jgi:hypothetical protein